MNKYSQAKKFVIVLGLLLGVSAISALATDYAGPKSAPPTCVTDPLNANYDPGCLPPINSGPTPQIKNGDLSVQSFLANTNSQFNGDVKIMGNLILPTGAVAGKVLKAVNASGTVAWADAPGSVALNIYFSDVNNLPIIGTKCMNGATCGIVRPLGAHAFCTLADTEVFVRQNGTFSNGDAVSCTVYRGDASNGGTDQWYISSIRGDSTTDVGTACQAVCLGGGSMSGIASTTYSGFPRAIQATMPSFGGGSKSGTTYLPL